MAVISLVPGLPEPDEELGLQAGKPFFEGLVNGVRIIVIPVPPERSLKLLELSPLLGAVVAEAVMVEDVSVFYAGQVPNVFGAAPAVDPKSLPPSRFRGGGLVAAIVPTGLDIQPEPAGAASAASLFPARG